MDYGNDQSSQKTREPYGKVTEVGQVPIALQEIEELAQIGLKTKNVAEQSDCFKRIQNMAQSALSVTCANPGCLSQMVEGMGGNARIAGVVESVYLRVPQSRLNHVNRLIFEPDGRAIRFSYDDTQYRVDSCLFVEEVTESGLERSRKAIALNDYLLDCSEQMEVQS